MFSFFSDPVERRKRNRDEFFAFLKDHFNPVIRELGFRGSGRHWRRIREPFVDCIFIQSSKWGDECCVNLGVHLTFLPNSLTEPDQTTQPCDISRIKQYGCVFQDRLKRGSYPQDWMGDSGRDYWWKYRKPQKRAKHLIETFQTYSDGFFSRFSRFPEMFTEIPIERIEQKYQKKEFGLRNLFVFARVYQHLGRIEEARQLSMLAMEDRTQAGLPFEEIIRATKSQ